MYHLADNSYSAYEILMGRFLPGGQGCYMYSRLEGAFTSHGKGQAKDEEMDMATNTHTGICS